MLRHIAATRYVTALREGGSLPALMEADDLGTYVVKFVGAGQGRKVLVAEVICGELARRLGLPVPELVTVDVDPLLGLSEPDAEVQDLLRVSAGLNLGMDFLPGALGFDPLAHHVPHELACDVLWFDAFVGNVDRSWRNPNVLVWHRDLWLIDHGATLVFHHRWDRAGDPAAPYNTDGHVLSSAAIGCRTWRADNLAAQITEVLLTEVLALVPDVWLSGEPGFDRADQVRQAYLERLLARVAGRKQWQP